jgi:hypothetical protein
MVHHDAGRHEEQGHCREQEADQGTVHLTHVSSIKLISLFPLPSPSPSFFFLFFSHFFISALGRKGDPGPSLRRTSIKSFVPLSRILVGWARLYIPNLADCIAQEDAVNICKDAFAGVAERDIYTGDQVEIIVITKDGQEKEYFPVCYNYVRRNGSLAAGCIHMNMYCRTLKGVEQQELYMWAEAYVQRITHTADANRR